MKYQPDKIRPGGDRVLVERLPVVEQTQGGIMVPDAARIQSLEQEAIVIQVGPGRRAKKTLKRIPIEGIEIGDRVLLARYAGQMDRPATEREDRLMVVDAKDIMGVLE